MTEKVTENMDSSARMRASPPIFVSVPSFRMVSPFPGVICMVLMVEERRFRINRRAGV